MSTTSQARILQVNNTFLEVNEDSGEEQLPRTISDQTHSRRKTPLFITKIETIKEDATAASRSIAPTSPTHAVLERADKHHHHLHHNQLAPVVEQTEHIMYQAYPMMPQVIVPESFKRTGGQKSRYGPPPGMQKIEYYSPSSTVVPGVSISTDLTPLKWHDAIHSMGKLSSDKRSFEKTEFEGRLSMLTEDTVRSAGKFNFAVKLEGSSLSAADGVGFVFGDQLPFRRNIQMIDSVFINRKGQVCVRSQQQLMNLRNSYAAPLELGRIVELAIDVDSCYAKFSVFDEAGVCLGQAGINYSEAIGPSPDGTQPTRSGFFCAVLKNTGTQLTLLH